MANPYRSKPKHVAGERKERKCLMCRQSFVSEWSGERVCRNCKSKDAWRRGERWLPGGRIS